MKTVDNPFVACSKGGLGFKPETSDLENPELARGRIIAEEVRSSTLGCSPATTAVGEHEAFANLKLIQIV